MVEKTSYIDAYEKLIQLWILCRQIVQVYSLHRFFLSRAIGEKSSETMILMSNVCYDYIVINWAKICGSDKENLHYKNVFSHTCVSPDVVRDKFLHAPNFTTGEYEIYWAHLRKLRNCGLAHFDFDQVYKLKSNDQFFDKIPVQCTCIAESVICAFEEECKLFPQRQCSISARSRPVSLFDIVKHLKEEWRACPLD